MRALSVREGIDPERLVRTAMAELQAYAKRSGGAGDAFLVLEVRTCSYEANISEPTDPEFISPGRS